MKLILSDTIAAGKRSRASRGATIVAGCALLILGIGAFLARDGLGGIAWLFCGVAMAGLAALVVWRPGEENAGGEDEALTVAQEAIRQEAERLDARRTELERVLMAYGEWMEFPDYQELRDTRWNTPARSARDAEVAALLDSESDRILKKFSSGEYFEDRKFQTRLLLLELWSFMERISRIYQPESERPFLETNLEALLKAVNRASLQVILLLEEVPIVEAKDWNLRRMSDAVRKASKVYQKYEDFQPILDPVRYLWQGSKFLLAANPLFAAGWIAGSELLRRGGKRIGKRALDGYLLSVVRQTLGIIAWETASIYDRTHRYRNPDWVFAVELAHLVSKFPLTRTTVREAFREIGGIPLRSSYDRIFLYRCIAQQVSPKPERFAQADLLARETRQAIVSRLELFREAHIETTKPRAVTAWRRDLSGRLDLAADDPPGP